jgi:cation diffusion facilitator CzcD-associated flavoprotein CzcO
VTFLLIPILYQTTIHGNNVFAFPEWRFFRAIRKGTASIVTDHIDRFLTDGILLKSGKALKADIITATGLDLLAFGGVKIQLDSQPFDISKSFVYKGLMLSDLPNFFFFVGYTNASWTLKVISLVNIFRDF